MFVNTDYLSLVLREPIVKRENITATNLEGNSK